MKDKFSDKNKEINPFIRKFKLIRIFGAISIVGCAILLIYLIITINESIFSIISIEASFFVMIFVGFIFRIKLKQMKNEFERNNR